MGCPVGFEPTPAGTQPAMLSHYTKDTFGRASRPRSYTCGVTARRAAHLHHRSMAAKAGIEPATHGLTDRCSTSELLRNERSLYHTDRCLGITRHRARVDAWGHALPCVGAYGYPCNDFAQTHANAEV